MYETFLGSVPHLFFSVCLVLVHQQDFLMEYVIQCALSDETIFKLNFNV